jgi:hypothetical protein
LYSNISSNVFISDVELKSWGYLRLKQWIENMLILRVIPRENRADSCNVGYIDVPEFAQSNFFG